MSDVSYLLNNIPNPVVDAGFLSTRPDLTGSVYLLGELPNNKVFLINNVTTKQRDTLAVSTTIKTGLVVFNTDEQLFQQYLSGTDWMTFQLNLPTKGTDGYELVKGGPGFDLTPATEITSEGDLIIGDTTGKPIRLPIGVAPTPSSDPTVPSEIAVLTIVAGKPSWGSALGISSGTSTDLSYVYTQTTVSSAWVINHNLNKYPSVTIVDSANTVVIGDIMYTSSNSLTVTFSGAFSGKAFLN